MDPVILRAGTPAGAPAMSALWNEATRARQAGIDLSKPEAIDAAQTLARPNTFSIVAESGGTLIGMGIGLSAREDEGRGPAPLVNEFVTGEMSAMTALKMRLRATT